MLKKVSVESAAEAYLEVLASRGVEYFFGNAGTDFAPLIEAYAKRSAEGQVLPRPLTIPHEITAVGMGSERPLVTPDNTPAKKAKNRRYEIQVRIGEGADLDRAEAAQELAEKTKSEVAQVLGNTLLLYRLHPTASKIVFPD